MAHDSAIEMLRSPVRRKCKNFKRSEYNLDLEITRQIFNDYLTRGQLHKTLMSHHSLTTDLACILLSSDTPVKYRPYAPEKQGRRHL